MREHIHTVYDRMEAKGYFAGNTANVNSRDPQTGESTYKREDFPMMLYHPEGKKRQTNPSVTVPGLAGPQIIPASFELIHKVVANAAERDKLVAEGWFDNPTDSYIRSLTDAEKLELEASGQMPVKSVVGRIEKQQSEIDRLKQELAEARAALALHVESED